MKALKVLRTALIIALFALSTNLLAYGGGSVGNDTGDGEPPGWSQNNPGAGGSDGPAEGPFGPGKAQLNWVIILQVLPFV